MSESGPQFKQEGTHKTARFKKFNVFNNVGRPLGKIYFCNKENSFVYHAPCECTFDSIYMLVIGDFLSDLEEEMFSQEYKGSNDATET